MNANPGEITQILLQMQRGDSTAQQRLIPLVYRELRRIAGFHLKHEQAGISLQPTALVHEAYIRLVEINRVQWQSRAHFLAVASTLMRRVLVDHARSIRARKRGAGQAVMTFDEALIPSPGRAPDILALDDALHQLARLDERQAKIVEMRFFAGMSEEETGEVLGISSRTVKRDWRVAKAWLYKELSC